ncbi:MAG: lipopolysaccharide transport periplasmic protein LptA [Campylobacterota bacterium]|nr:lipopolysaccharide transport periplasmic protein LptA [Campylobacterota bacterium]
MKHIIILIIFLNTIAFGQELKIKANVFQADEKKGISIFEGDVNIVKKNDELNASKVTIYTNKKNQPVKYIALGNVAFKIATKQGAKYEGTANKVIFLPKDKEYHFYENVFLRQINEKKEIQGDEVILNITDGQAYAKGVKKGPVIMIFDIAEEEE